MKVKHIVPSAAALALVVGAICFFTERRDAGGGTAPEADAVRTVRLASRTITVAADEGSVPRVTVPEMPAVLSRRGTAPFLVVSKEKAARAVRDRIAACGARVTGVVPPYGIVVEADAAALRKITSDGSFLAVENLVPADKTAGSLRREIASGADKVTVTVVPLHKDDSHVIEKLLEKKGCDIIHAVASDKGSVRAEVPAEAVMELAERGDVRWVERFSRPELLVDVAVRPGLLNVTPIRGTYGLTGKGQYLTISDSGLDTGDVDTIVDDFRGRIGFLVTVQNCLEYDRLGHGTHVAGIAVGNGSLSGGWFKGVAYEANMNIIQFMNAENKIYLPAVSALLAVYSDGPSYLHSCSWGGAAYSAYTSLCVEFDAYLWSNPSVLAVFAVGNISGSYSVFAPAGAKNVIAVGATGNDRPYMDADSGNMSHVASFSAKGPMADGRVKPDICAPGSYVVSARSTQCSTVGHGLYPGFDRYMYDSGTSMATPFVSGCAVLIRQWLTERRGYSQPTAALMKAVLTGGAYDMGSDSGASCGGAAPNSQQGWGRVDLGQSLYPTNATVMLADRIAFSEGSSYSVQVTLTNRAPLAVQLVWTDYPGTEGAAQDIVNDLDLVVSNETTGAVWYGNGVSGGDRTNTVESVRIPSPEVTPGVYRVYVKGTSVLYDSSEGGAAALYVRGAFSEEVSDSWQGDTRTEFTVRSYMLLSNNKGYRWMSSAVTAAKGETLRFSVPESVPGGADPVDVSSYIDSYPDEDGTAKTMTVQRIGRIEIAEPDAASGSVVTNASGHMATSFSLTVDGDKDILFMFFDEASTNVSTSLPTWWYKRYVEGDPLADVVRFTSVSPTRVEWTGGAAFHRTLERSASLGSGTDWRAVYECPPAPVLTNGWNISPEYSTNSFFRIR